MCSNTPEGVIEAEKEFILEECQKHIMCSGGCPLYVVDGNGHQVDCVVEVGPQHTIKETATKAELDQAVALIKAAHNMTFSLDKLEAKVDAGKNFIVKECMRLRKEVNKTVVIINGKGGVGKDTICGIVAKHYVTINRSSITPVKAVAELLGWSNNDKSDKSRKFLSDIKMLSTEYNDYPFKYMLYDCDLFMLDPLAEVMFMHVREPVEIDRLKQTLTHCKCKTLLIRSNRIKDTFGNSADDGVENYAYDYIYQNDKPLEEIEDDFMPFFRRCIMEERVCARE